MLVLKPWLICSSFRRAVARRRRTWVCQLTRWPYGDCKARLLGESAVKVWRCSCATRCDCSRSNSSSGRRRSSVLVSRFDARHSSTAMPVGVRLRFVRLVGGRKTTPNRTDDSVEAIKQARGNQFVGGGTGTPYQLTACPWCGSAIEAGKHLDAQPYPHGSGRTLTYCGDKFGQCLFSKRKQPTKACQWLWSMKRFIVACRRC